MRYRYQVKITTPDASLYSVSVILPDIFPLALLSSAEKEKDCCRHQTISEVRCQHFTE